MEHMNQMMSNPMMSQMMQQMLSDPNHIAQLENHPVLGAQIRANPLLRQQMRNPDFIRQVTNPETMRHVMQMQESMRYLQGQGMAPAAAGMPMGGMGMPAAAGTAQPPAVGGLDFTSLLGAGAGAGTGTGAAAAAAAATAAQPTVPPAERWASEIQQLTDMGFGDAQANARALQLTGGNVHAAVERLLSGGS
jgi:ubiquilin